ncbi:TPA: RHS domain-containing protein, partial [Proteus mirabilis]|nr:RHS domain-containing protein [Proteus mirabilis]
YDVNGRLAKKIVHTRGFRPREWRYLWNTQNQLTACFTPKGDCWHYTYDAFGRRLSKTKTVDSDLAHIDPLFPQIKPKITTWRYLWSGDQLIEETPIYADGTLAESQQIQWLYQPGEITPTARYQQGKLHYVVTDHQGTPREIFSEGGQASWAGRLNTWGQMQFWRYREGKAENDPNYTECPFRFAGQYEDEESGLYYNRFRYYDRETGQYLSPDPIGLLGGLNPYGYVHCPTGWVDPFGLACCPPPKIKATQIGLRNPKQIDGMKKDMLDGTFDFSLPKNQVGGFVDSNGIYYMGEGHHRMVAAQEIYKETGDAKYINKLIENGSWTRTNSPPTDARAMPSRSFFSNLRNKLGF